VYHLHRPGTGHHLCVGHASRSILPAVPWPLQSEEIAYADDDSGNRTQSTNAAGHEVNYQYNALNHLASVLSDTVDLTGTVTVSKLNSFFERVVVI
jgi:YD repeat-containing protein